MKWNNNLDSGGVLVSGQVALEFDLSPIKKGSEERAAA